jgi:hypothetical protein
MGTEFQTFFRSVTADIVFHFESSETLCQNMHNVRNVKHVPVGCWCSNVVKQGQIKF